MAKYEEKKDEAILEEVPEKNSESSENIEVQPEPPKPLVHIDQFMNTAKQLYNLNNMQIAGFKVYMQGRHYQYDQEVFLQELKKYLNLK